MLSIASASRLCGPVARCTARLSRERPGCLDPSGYALGSLTRSVFLSAADPSHWQEAQEMSDATTYSVATACIVDKIPFLILPEASTLTFPVTEGLRKRLADLKEDCFACCTVAPRGPVGSKTGASFWLLAFGAAPAFRRFEVSIMSAQKSAPLRDQAGIGVHACGLCGGARSFPRSLLQSGHVLGLARVTQAFCPSTRSSSEISGSFPCQIPCRAVWCPRVFRRVLGQSWAIFL